MIFCGWPIDGSALGQGRREGRVDRNKSADQLSFPLYLFGRTPLNLRKTTTELGLDDVERLMLASGQAGAHGAPLNTLITFRLAEIEARAPADRAEGWHDIRRQVSIRLARLAIVPRYVWTREADVHGPGEHMHLVAHIPAERCDDVERALRRWRPGPQEVHVAPWSPITVRARNGRDGSSTAYVGKQVSPQTARALNINRQRGGPIVGRRWGLTRNLLKQKHPHPKEKGV